MPPTRIESRRLSPETRRLGLAFLQALQEDLRETPINGVQITLDNWRDADQPPTIDVRYV